MSKNTVQHNKSLDQADNSKMLNVSEAAQILGVSPSTLRNYEKDLRITSIRQDNGYRVFRLEEIQKLKEELRLEKIQKETTEKLIKKERLVKYNLQNKIIEQPVKLPAATEEVKIQATSSKPLNLRSKLPAFLLVTLTILTIMGFGFKRNSQPDRVLSYAEQKAQRANLIVDSTGLSADVLGYNVKLGQFDMVFHLASEFLQNVIVKQDLTVGQDVSIAGLIDVTGQANLAGGVQTPSINLIGVASLEGLAQIDETTETTLENSLDIAGDVVSVNNNGLTEVRLAEELSYNGTLKITGTINLDGTFEIAGSEVTTTADEINVLSGLTTESGGVYFGDGSTFAQDSVNFFWNDSTDRLGLGTNTPTSTLDVSGTVTTTGLILSTGAANGYVLTSDASGNASWQSAGSTGPWQTTSNIANLITSTDNVTIGSNTNLGKLAVDGDSNEIQLLVQGNSTQSADLVTFEDSSGTDLFNFSNTGDLTIASSLILNSETIDDITGNGLTLSAGALTIQTVTATNGLSSTITNGSGLEVFSGGISLLQGCANGEVLKWNETNDSWECATDSGAASAIINVESNDTPVGANVDTLDFTTDFNLSASPANEVNISIADDILDYGELQDTLDLDATTETNLGASNLVFDLDSTGDFIVQDGGTAFVQFLDDGTARIGQTDYINIGSTGDLTFVDANDGASITGPAGGNLTIDAGNGEVSIGTNDNLNLSSAVDLVFGGVTSLGETTGATDSGAYLVGVFDEFANSNSTNVQAVLNDLDAAVGSGASKWTQGTGLIYLTSTTDEVIIGGSASLSSKLAVDGDNDEIQLLVQGNGTQTTNLVVFENSAGTDQLSLTNGGNLTIAGDIAISGGNITSAITFDSTATATGTLTANGTFDANGVVTLGDDGDSIAISGTTIGITSNGATNDITLNSADDILFDDTQLSTSLPLALADNALNASLTQGIVDAINDVYDAATGTNGGLWTLSGGVIYPTTATNDFAVGGTSLASSIFSIDESAGTFLFGGDQSANPTLTFEATNSDTASISFGTTDTFTISGGSLDVNSNAAFGDQGSVSTTTGVNISEQFSDTSGTLYGTFSRAWAVAGADSSASYIGVDGNATIDSSVSSNITGNAKGFNSFVNHLGTGTLSSAYGLYALVDKGSTGPITTAYGVYSEIRNLSATNAITNAYGIYIADSTETGTITNDYGIYQVDTGAVNYFGGAIGLADTSPDAKLEVLATSEQLRLSYADGSADARFSVDTNGDLTIDVTGGNVTLASGDNLNLTAATDLIFGGTTSLGETTGATDSGAYLVGTFDEFNNSNGANVQDVLDDLDAAIGAGASKFTQGTGLIYLTNTTDEVIIGGSASLSSKLAVDGDNDEIQLLVQGNGTQTANLVVFETSAGSDLLSLSNSGDLTISNSLLIGSTALDVNSLDFTGTGTITTGTNTALTLTPAGTGDIVLGTDDDSNISTTGSLTSDTGTLFDLNLTLVNDTDADTISAINIDVTSANTGDADTMYGIQLGNVTSADGTVVETALRVGEAWDFAFEVEGSTNDSIETFIAFTDPTSSDKTITFPNETGTVCLSSGNCAGGAGGSKWTDGGAVTYLTSVTDDLAVGGTDSTSSLFFDESAELLTLTNTTAGNSFVVNDVAADTTPFVIDASGSVAIGITTPTTGTKLEVNGSTAEDADYIAIFNQDNNANENSTNVFLDNDLNLGTISAVARTIQNLDMDFDPSVMLSSSGSGEGRLNAYGIYNTIEVSGLDLGNSDTEPLTQNTYGELTYVVGSPTINDTVGTGGITIEQTGVYGLVSYTPTITNLASSTTFTTIAGQFVNLSTNSSNANLTNYNFGISAVSGGSLGTAGTTQHVGGTFTAGDLADNNYAIYVAGAYNATNNSGIYIADNITDGATNYALYSAAPEQSYLDGNLGLGDTTPDAKLEVLATTEQLRLSYADGTQASFTVDTNGDLGIDASGGDVTLASGDNLNITAATDIIFGGTTSLGETTGTTDSGAYLVGVFDEFANSNAANVQDVLDDLDAAIGAGASKWTQGTGLAYLTNTTDEVILGGSASLSSKLAIDGDNDEIQLLVQGNGTQTTNLAVFENSAGADQLALTNTGNLTIAGDFTVTGGDIAGANSATIDVGEATTGAITFGANSTGDYVFTIDADTDVRTTGGTDGTDALVIPAGDILISDGDLDLSGGDFNIALDAGDGANITKTAAPTVDVFTINAGTSATDGVDSLQLTFTADDASGNIVDISPTFTDNNADDTSETWNIIDIDSFTATVSDTGGSAITGNVRALNIGALTETTGNGDSITSSALNIGTGWDTVINAGADTDQTAIIGRIRIDARASDLAYFSHYDQSGLTGYALRQGANGATVLNSESGQVLTLASGNIDEVALNTTELYPATSDGSSLGSATNMWADLFLANGSVVSLNAGDVTLTHSTNLLTLAGGDLTLGSGADLNLSAAGDLVFGGTTSLGETTGATDSGAYLVGTFDEFNNSNGANVQDVLDDLDAAIGAGASKFTQGTGLIYLTNTTDEVIIGGSASLSSKLAVDGDNDEIQLLVQGNGTQTADLVVFETSAGADLFTLTGSGNLGLGDATPDAKLEILATSEQLRLTYADGTADARFSVDTNGDITLTSTGGGTAEQLILANTQVLNVGGSGSTDVAYNIIGDSASVTLPDSDDDLYIEGSLEVDSAARFEGDTDLVLAGTENLRIENTTYSDNLGGVLYISAATSTGADGNNPALGINWTNSDDATVETQTALRLNLTNASASANDTVYGIEIIAGAGSDETDAALHIQSATSGGFGDGILIDGTTGTVTNAINIDSPGIVVTDINLQNGESIDNDTDNQITLGLGTTGTLLLSSGISATIANNEGDIILNSTDEVVLGDTDTLIIGGHAGNVAYNVVSDAGGSPGSGSVSSDNDLYIQGFLEIDGGLQVDATLTATDFTCTDCLDFAEFENTLDVDETTDINLGTSNLTIDLDSSGIFDIRDGATTFVSFDDDSTIDITFPAAGTLGIDAATTDNTTTDGVFDLNVDTVTNTNIGLNIDHIIRDSAGITAYGARINQTIDTDAGNSSTGYGLYIAADNDDATSTITGLYVNADADAGGEGNEYAAAFMGGFVGIGTASPQGLLHLSSTDSYLYISDNNAAVGSKNFALRSSSGRLGFHTGTDAFAMTERLNLRASGGVALGATFVNNDPGANNMIIEGDLGIGASSPGAKLEIANGYVLLSNNYGYRIKDSSGTAANAINLSGTDNYFFGGRAGSDIYIGTNPYLLVKHTGSVGLNDNSPGATFEIAKIGVQKLLLLSSTAAADGDLLTVDSTGNVGIGDSTPDALLDVDGAVTFDLLSASTFEIDAVTSDNISTTGVINLDVDTITSTNKGISIDYQIEDAATDITTYSVKNDITVDSDAGHSPTVYGDYIGLTVNDATSTTYGIAVVAEDAGTQVVNTGVLIENLQATDIDLTDALLIRATTNDSIVDALDVSDAEIINAINLGTNFAVLDATRIFESSSGVITFEDTSGNDLLTLTDNANAGDLAITGTYSGDTISLSSGSATAASFTRSSAGQWIGFNDGTDAWGLYNTAGSPEGSLTANTGAISMDTTNGTLYVKTDDGDNSGWVNLATGGSSPFTSSGGIIDYTTATDRLRLAVGETGDIGLEVLGVASQTASSLFIDNATNTFLGTTGALDINVVAGNAAVIGADINIAQSNGATTATDVIAQNITLAANDADGDVFGTIIISSATANAAAGSYEALLKLVNAENTIAAVTDAILIDSTSSTDLDITDALDVSNANIVNALNSGQNFILGDGIRQFSSSSTVWTFEDTSGNDLFTLTDNGSDGNATVTGDLTVSGGDISGVSGESIDLGEATADTLTFTTGASTELRLNTTNLTPGAAEGNSLGSATAEWEQLFLGDDNGLSFGLDQDWTLAYDETTDDRLELVTYGTSRMLISSATVIGTALLGAFDSVTTGRGMGISVDALTTGDGFKLQSTTTSTSFSGNIGLVEWEPGSATAATGDLFQINIGANGTTTGRLFTVTDTNSNLFSVKESIITSALPHEFTAAGDVSIAYDIVLTNQTSSQIESYGPMSIIAGESFESSNLTLKTYNSGDIIFDIPATGYATFQGAVSLDTYATFTAADTTPDVSGGSYFNTAGTATITDFDAGSGTLNAGHMLVVQCDSAVTFDVTASGLNGGSTDIVCADGDMLTWIYDGTDWNLLGWMDDSTDGGQDLAEYFVSNETLDVGDVVAIDPTQTEKVIRSNVAYQTSAIGVVSTKPGLILGGPDSEDNYLVGLAGRVPVKISANSETIEPGDYLTSSDQAGKAMKATQTGRIIGQALEAWNPGSGNEKIMMFINTGWYTADNLALQLDELGNLSAQYENLSTLISTNVEEATQEVVAGISTTIESRVETLENNDTNLQAQIDAINTILGETNESSESTEASASMDVTAMLTQMLDTFSSFQSFIAALGITSETDAEGNDILSVASDMVVLGDSTLNNVQITGDLGVGLIQINSLENSVDVVGPTCYGELTGLNQALCGSQALFIQKGLSGNVDFFDGKIVLLPDGTISTTGTLEANKVVANEFVLNDTSTLVGEGIITAGQNEIVITNAAVKNTSKIFVTAKTSTGGEALYVTEKIDNTSFKVKIDSPLLQDVSFDWWILNLNEKN